MKPPYTRAQIQAASPKRPAHEGAYLHNHYLAFDALTAILTGDKPTQAHWAELANIANVMMSLCMQNQISDPQGSIHDAVEALRKARDRPTIRFTGVDRYAVINMLEEYVYLCKNIPDRTIKSAVNYAFNCQQQTRNL